MPRPSHPSGFRTRPAVRGSGGLAGLVLILAGAVSAGAQTAEGASRRERLDALVASVGAYVERFQVEMEAAVLDESYVQLLRQPCCREPRRPGEDPLLAWDETNSNVVRRGVLARRQLKSEVLLVQDCRGPPGRLSRRLRGRRQKDPGSQRTRSKPLSLRNRGERARSRPDRGGERALQSRADAADHESADAAAALPRAGDADAALLLARRRRRGGRNEDDHPRVPRRREPDARGLGGWNRHARPRARLGRAGDRAHPAHRAALSRRERDE